MSGSNFNDSDKKPVVGPASSTDNAIVVYDGTTGKTVKNSATSITTANHLLLGSGKEIYFGSTSGAVTAIKGETGSGGALTLGHYSSAPGAYDAYAQVRTGFVGIGFSNLVFDQVNKGVEFNGGETFIGTATQVEFTGDLQIIGAQKLGTVLFGAGNNVATTADSYVVKTAITGGGDTITLPDATVAANDGIRITIKDGGTAGVVDTITIDTAGGNIDGAATKTIITAYGHLTVFAANSQWYIESESL